MCGIIGYVGSNNASEVITFGLKRLEYRGYDSVGIATLNDGAIEVRKDAGMVEPVSESQDFRSMKGNIGIGHTRWATHGSVCKKNSHPHLDNSSSIVIVHNGVIENFSKLKSMLESEGHVFASDTDSEVIAHLVSQKAGSMPIEKAFSEALSEIDGSYAVVAFSASGNGTIMAARRNSPLVIGIGKGEMLCASDIPAMLNHTKTFVPLEDGDMAFLTSEGYRIIGPGGTEVRRSPFTVDWDPKMAEKGGYPHFMKKEIAEQKDVICASLASDVSFAKSLIDEHEKIHVVAAGTSFHAGLVLSDLLSRKGKTAQAFIASDYPFSVSPGENTLVIAISQSGETADVLQALRHAGKSRKIGITNVVGSTITSLCDAVVFLNSGPEVGVAATKTFTSQLAVIYKMAYDGDLSKVPSIVETMLGKEGEVEKIAAALQKSEHAFFLGRCTNMPIASEGSLKFKEITYIHSEAYPSGELKHGTLSLITEGTPVIVLAPKDAVLPKLFGNLKEAKARGGFIVSLTNDDDVKKESDLSISLPDLDDPMLYPFALIIPLQLLAYHVSVLRGINPDRPRNLAKSVTVE